MNRDNIINPEKLELEEYYDPRYQIAMVFLREHDKMTGKSYYYKLVREESGSYYDLVGEDDSCFKLNGRAGDLKALLQRIVNYAYDRHNVTPSSMKLQNDAQKYHLEDMRKLVFEK